MTFPRLRTLAVIVGLLSTLTACTTSSGGPSAAGGEEAAASGVALKYATALFNGQLDQARALVEPGSQSTFGLVAAGIAQQVLKATGLGLGTTEVAGNRATTILIGDLCRVSGTGTPGANNCVSNHDPNSTNPIFKVATARQSSGIWLVTLTRLPAATSGGALPTSRNATSTAQPSS